MQHQTLHLAQGTIERLRLRQIDEEAP
jgi:hypothetical protein